MFVRIGQLMFSLDGERLLFILINIISYGV